MFLSVKRLKTCQKDIHTARYLFHGETMCGSDIIVLKNAYIFLYMLKLDESNFYRFLTNGSIWKKYNKNARQVTGMQTTATNCEERQR